MGNGGGRSRRARGWALVLGTGAVVMIAMFLTAFAHDVASATPVCAKTWTGANSSAWTNNANWSPSGAPGGGDYVCLPSTANTATIATGATISVAGINLTGPLTINGTGALNLTDSTGTKSSAMSGGTLAGNGTLVIGASHALVWTGGQMSGGTGQVTVATGATLAVDTSSGSIMLSGARKLVNNGTITVAGTSNWNLSSIGSGNPTPTITNNATFTFTDDASTAYSYDPGTIVNTATGVLQKTGGTGTSTINAIVDNDGTVTATSGTLSLDGGSGANTSTGTFTTFGSAVALRFDGGVHTLGNGAQLGGSIAIAGGEVDIANGATASVTGNLTMSGGTLSGNGTLVIGASHSFTWTGGQMSGGTGQVTVTAGATLAVDTSSGSIMLSGARSILDNGTITVAGTSNWNLSSIGSGNPAPTITNNATFTFTDDASTAYSYDPGTIVNTATGVLQKTGGTGTSTINAIVDNDGTVTATSGTLSLDGGSGANTSTGTFGAAPGGVVEMDGTYTLAAASVPAGRTLTMGASANLPGTLTVNGTLAYGAGSLPDATTVAAGGTLAVDTYLGASTLSGARSIVNNGTITVAGTSNWNLSSIGSGNPTPTITNNATFTFTDDASTAYSYDPGTIVNTATGVLQKTGGTGTSTINAIVDNDGTVTATSGTLSLDGGSGANTSTGTFTTAGGVLRFDGGVHTLGNGAQLGGTEEIAGGEVDIANGATASVTGNLTMSGGTLSGNGTLIITSGHSFTWTGGQMSGGTGQVTVTAGATLAVDTSSGSIMLSGARSILNNGTITVAGTSNWNLSSIGSGNPAPTITNNATFTFTDDASTAYSYDPGTITNTATGVLQKTGGTGTSTINAIVDNPGTINAVSGTLELDGLVQNAQATKTLSAGTYIVQATLRILNADFATSSATIVLDGSSATMVDGNNQSALRNLASNTSTGSLTVENGQSLVVKPLTNAGTVIIGPGPATISMAGNYTQTGGSTSLVSANAKLVTSGSGKALANGGTISGIGTLQAGGTPGVTDSATVSPGTTLGAAGTLSVTGSWSQTSTGALRVDVNGTGAAQADALAVSGAATLGGTLDVHVGGGYAPALGDAITIMTYASRGGSFASVNNAQLSGGLSWQVQYNATNAVLRVVKPSVSIAGTSVAEGNSGTSNANATVSLSEPAGATITVDFTLGGTATTSGSVASGGSDYVAPASSTVTFAPGDTSKQVTFTINGDTTYETDDAITITLTNPTNATIATGAADVTITNDDTQPVVSVAGPASPVTEGNSGTTPATFTVSLSNPSAFSSSVQYATADGTASAPSDYTAIPSTSLGFSAGTVSQNVSVNVNGDTQVEPDETFSLQLSSPSGATLGTSTANSAIKNDDASATTVSISAGTAFENAGTLPLTLTLTPPATASGTILLDTTDVSATGGFGTCTGADYQALASFPVTVNAGDSSIPVNVTLCDDTVVEGNETFSATITSLPKGFTGAGASSTATIADDDHHLSKDDASWKVLEGNGGSQLYNLKVKLDPVSTATVTVQYQFVAGGSATPGTDYSGASGTLTFAPGVATRTIPVTINGDTALEGNEAFDVHLFNAIGATIDNDPFIGTILDDDNSSCVSSAGVSMQPIAGGGFLITGTDGDDTICGSDGNDLIKPGKGSDIIYAGLGSDTVDYSGYADSVTVDLGSNGAPGFAAGPSAGSDSLFGIENANGTQGNDLLLGNELINVLDGQGGNDVFRPGAAGDTVKGAAGNDTVDYSTASHPVVVRLDTASQTASGTDIGSDKLSAVENATGGDGNDTLVGSSAGNVLTGGLGNDSLIGNAGNDTLHGDGGEDGISYVNATSGVTVTMKTHKATGGDGTDTFDGIEDVLGSTHDDAITGDDAANHLSGWDGKDQIRGWGGDDIIHGNGGDDLYLQGDDGNDQIYGDGGDDGFVLSTGTWNNLTGGPTGTDWCSQGDNSRHFNHNTCDN